MTSTNTLKQQALTLDPTCSVAFTGDRRKKQDWQDHVDKLLDIASRKKEDKETKLEKTRRTRRERRALRKLTQPLLLDSAVEAYRLAHHNYSIFKFLDPLDEVRLIDKQILTGEYHCE